MAVKKQPTFFSPAMSTPTWLFCHELEGLWEFAEVTEQFLEQHKDKLEQAIEKRAEGLDDHSKDQLYDHYSDQWARVAQEFPLTLRSSLVVAVYGQFEHFILRRARTIGAAKKLAVVPSDLKGKGIWLAQKYYERILMLPFPSDSSSWKEIEGLNGVRNCLVHSAGEVSPKNKQLLKFIDTHPHLDLDEFGEVVPDPKYVFVVIAAMVTFSQQLDKIDGLSATKMLHVDI